MAMNRKLEDKKTPEQLLAALTRRMEHEVERTADGCILWLGGHDRTSSNPVVYLGGSKAFARRLLWESHHNVKLDRVDGVYMTCGHKSCLNLDHMRVGSINRPTDTPLANPKPEVPTPPSVPAIALMAPTAVERVVDQLLDCKVRPPRSPVGVADKPCVIWAYGIDSLGYPIVCPNVKGRTKRIKVHQIVWELAYGPLPEDYIVKHVCGDIMCLELTHLSIHPRKGCRTTRRIHG